MSNIFISYAKQDKVIARKIVTRLESGGISCWIYPRNVKDSSNRTKETIEAVRKNDIFIIILSKFSENSKDQKAQIAKAIEAGIPIIPIKIGALMSSLTMDYFLQTLEWVDVYGDGFETAYEILLEIIDEIFDKDKSLKLNQTKDKITDSNNKKYNNNYIIAAVVTMIIAVAIIFYVFKNDNKKQVKNNILNQNTQIDNDLDKVSLSSSDKKLVGRWRILDYKDSRIIPEKDREQTEKAIEQTKKNGMLIFQANKVFRRLGFSNQEQNAMWEFSEYEKKIFLKVNDRTEIMHLASFSDSLMTMIIQEPIEKEKQPITTKIIFKKEQ